MTRVTYKTILLPVLCGREWKSTSKTAMTLFRETERKKEEIKCHKQVGFVIISYKCSCGRCINEDNISFHNIYLLICFTLLSISHTKQWQKYSYQSHPLLHSVYSQQHPTNQLQPEGSTKICSDKQNQHHNAKYWNNSDNWDEKTHKHYYINYQIYTL